MRFLTVLMIANLAALAQSPEPARGDVVFSVTSTLVQIDAVVLDGKGRQVTNLGPADFDVLIDGKPQTITHFSYVRVTPETAQPQARRTGKPDAALAIGQLPRGRKSNAMTCAGPSC